MPGLLWRFFPTPFPWAVIHREVTVEIGTIGSQYRFSDGIGEVGTTPEIEEAVRALAGGLNASDSGERTSCALALAFIGPNARHASADLAEMFKRRDISEKLFVCQAFGTIGACPEAKESVKILTDALTTSNHVLKQYVADALANIGPLASVATPTLANMLTNDDPHLRKSAVRALARIGNVPADTRPRLLSLLKSPEPFTRAGAAVALLRFDSNDVAAIGFVRDCLAPDKESSLRSSTVYLIMDSEPLVRIFLTDIRQLTNDPDIPVAMFSRKAMKQIKPEVVAAGDK